MLVFAAVIGLTFLSTVPPTAGLVAKFFGPAHMATLFGIVMLAHQLGGFLGAWLGGKAFDWTGSYDWMWYADIVLAVGAALVHLPIRETAAAAARGARRLSQSAARRGDAGHDVVAVGLLPALDQLAVLVQALAGQAVLRMPFGDPCLDGVVRDRMHTLRLVEAADRQVDALRALVLEAQRRAAVRRRSRAARTSTRRSAAAASASAPASLGTLRKAARVLPKASWHMRQWQ